MTRPRSIALIAALLAAAALAAFLLTDQPPAEPTSLEGDDPRPASERPTPTPLRADDRATDTATGIGTGAAAQDRDPIDGILTGIVVDERDRGIPGAGVEVFRIDPRGLRGAPYPDGPQLAETRAERDGTFRLPAPARTWLRLVASSPGRATVGLRIAATGTDVVMRLREARRLTVSARSEDDEPVADATVQVQLEDSQAEARTAADGTVSFDALPPGTAWVRAAAPGYGTVRAGPVALSSAPASITIVLTPGVRLTGLVVDDADSRPVANAQVVVARPGSSDVAAPTGDDGRFGPLHAGGRDQRVFAAVRAEGYAPLLEPVILQGVELQSIELRLVRATAWRGTVRTRDGRPAAGAHVAYGDDGVPGLTPASTTADEQGRFSLPPPPPPAPGRRVVLFARDATGTAALGLRPDMLPPEPLVLTLSRAAGVSGRVVDAQGAGLAGVEVRLTPAWERIPKKPVPDAATSLVLLANETGFLDLSAASRSDGSWALAGVPPAPYLVRFRWAGGQHWRDDVLDVTAAGAQAGTEILGGGYPLGGRLIGGDGRPIAGAQVRVVDVAARVRNHRTTSDADGHYEVRGLPPATYRVRASLGSVESEAVDVALASAVYDADLVFAESAVLAGRVVSGERPYDGLLTMTLRSAGGRASTRPPHHLRVRAGAFRWSGAPVGTWIIESRAPDGRCATSRTAVEVDAGRVVTTDLALVAEARIAGTLLTPEGEPVASARVTLSESSDGRRRPATTDERGQFVFSGLPAGAYRLDAWGRGGAPASTSFDLAGGERRKVRLKLERGGSARVQVVDERGRPVPAAIVLFRSAAGALPGARPDRTGRDGVLLRRDLPLGPVEARARDARGREGRGRLQVHADRTVDLQLRLTDPPPR